MRIKNPEYVPYNRQKENFGNKKVKKSFCRLKSFISFAAWN
jgi:hypothetical protein